MFEIDRLIITTKLKDNEITEDAYFAIFGNNALKLSKELFSLKENDEEKDQDDELIDIYNNHITEARSRSIKHHLIDLEKKMDSFIKSNILIKEDGYDKYSYDKYSYSDEETIDHYIETAIYLLDSEKLKQSMIKLDKIAYYKAQELFWKDKIDNELSRIEKEQRDEKSDKNEE